MTDLQPFDDERVSAYLDGELTGSELAEFEAMLQQRSDYAQAVEQLRTMRQGIQGLPQQRLPADFADRVLRRAEREMLVGTASEPSLTRPPAWSRQRWIAIGATVLAASLLVMFVARQTRAPRQTAERERASSEITAAAPVESPPAAVADTPVAADAKWEAEAQPMRAAARDLMTDELTEAAPEPAAAPQRELRSSAPQRVVDRSAMGGHRAGEVLQRRPFGNAVTTSNQQLVEQARSWQQQPEAVADEWDIVVATQLRSPEDWQQLKSALKSNQMELDAQSVASTEQPKEADELSAAGEDDFDAVAMNERLLNRLDRYRADREEQAEEIELLADRELPTLDEAVDDADTYVLYVEGTPEQLYGLVNQLPNTSQLVNIKTSESYFAGTRINTAKSAAMRSQGEQLSLLESADDTLPGRAANLGPSRLNDALSPTVRGRAKQVSSAWQQAQAAQTKPATDKSHLQNLRGVIILQDVSSRPDSQSAPGAAPGDAP